MKFLSTLMKTNKLLTLFAVATLPFLASCISEAERQRIAAEKAEQARIAKEAEQKRLEEEARLEKERLERERVAELERLKKAREEAKKKRLLFEKQEIRERYLEEIRPSEQKLSEDERSRGRALLDAFGEEQMPVLAELCKNSRLVYLEAEANFDELINALKAENVDLKTNEVFQTAGNRWLDLAAEYWWLRYKLTDFYSQFKIGAITSDELAERDAEFAEK